jgi:hypothetical protein
MDPKSKDNNSVVIDIKNSRSEAEKYFCSYCNTRLTPYTQEDKIGGYLCIKCTIEYWPNQTPVKKADKFDLPGPATDSHGNVIDDKTIPIAILDNNIEPSSTTYKQAKLTRAYEALSRHGYRFTSYEEK